jgi:hypothetical protein
MRRRRNIALAAALVCSLATAMVAADREEKAKPAQESATSAPEAKPDSKSKSKSDRNGKSDKKRPVKPLVSGYTEGREAAALAFVRTNHPELIDLLEPLKAMNPAEYQKAIRDLFLTSERLGEMQQRNPQRYELELQDWKLVSRIQVLAVRLALNENAPLEREMRELLAEQQETRRQLLLFERDRLATRLADIDTQLTELDRDPAKKIDSRATELVNAARATQQQAEGDHSSGSKNSKQTPSKKTD